MERNEQFELAWQYVENTSENVFLTGKAGTGKTTFLKYVKERSRKKLVIAAPTGVAAINAGGVTLHSLFQLPIGMYMPHGYSNDDRIVDRQRLLKSIHLRTEKKTLIRELELLIIDEVSMLRADVLDMIDIILRHVRGNQLAFGGLQMLFIGDLFQLPPIVDENYRPLMLQFYPSEFFYDALVLQQSNMQTIQLDTIYRQQDPHFIHLLNQIRNNQCTEDDLELLNRQHDEYFDLNQEDNFVLLSTHNYKVDKVNQAKLYHLESDLYTFEGDVLKDFPESMFPVNQILEVKVGAQVMFIRNDTSENRAYYNGKLATVVSIVKNEDVEYIMVRFENGEEYKVEKSIWRNVKYQYNSNEDSIDETVKGEFHHFPIRCAWAVTVHKSQGLTFDEVIIDVADSFTAGQVYVALSRSRTLKGIKLLRPISNEAIMTNQAIVDFQSTFNAAEDLKKNLPNYKIQYFRNRLVLQYELSVIPEILERIMQIIHESTLKDGNKYLIRVREIFYNWKKHEEGLSRFRNWISNTFMRNEYSLLQDKFVKALDYYNPIMIDEVLSPLMQIIEEWKLMKNTKKMVHDVQKLYDRILAKVLNLQEVYVTDFVSISNRKLFEDQLRVKVSNEILENEKYKKLKPSIRTSMNLWDQLKNTELIAKQRGLALSTIEGHIQQALTAEAISINDLLDKETISKISSTISNYPNSTVTELYNIMNGSISYCSIRWVMSTKKQ